jgi:hypothetical protein
VSVNASANHVMNSSIPPQNMNVANTYAKHVKQQRKRTILLYATIEECAAIRQQNIPLILRLTRARREFYLMANDPDSKVSFQIQEAQLLVRHIKPNPAILHAHNTTLEGGGIAKYHVTTVDVKTSTFASSSTSLSIDNAVLGTLPKRLLFTLVKNKEYLGTLDSNPYNCRHYGLRETEL